MKALNWLIAGVFVGLLTMSCAVVDYVAAPFNAAPKACEEIYSNGEPSDAFYQAICKADLTVQAGWQEVARQKEMGVLSVYLVEWEQKLTDAGNRLSDAQDMYEEQKITSLNQEQILTALIREIERWAYKQ